MEKFLFCLVSASIALLASIFIFIVSLGGNPLIGKSTVGWGLVGLIAVLILAVVHSNRQRKRV